MSSIHLFKIASPADARSTSILFFNHGQSCFGAARELKNTPCFLITVWYIPGMSASPFVFNFSFCLLPFSKAVSVKVFQMFYVYAVVIGILLQLSVYIICTNVK